VTGALPDLEKGLTAIVTDQHRMLTLPRSHLWYVQGSVLPLFPGSIHIFTKAHRHKRRHKSKLCIRLHVGWYSLVVQIHQALVYTFMYYALVPFVYVYVYANEAL
jgi:hypothetical protein